MITYKHNLSPLYLSLGILLIFSAFLVFEINIKNVGDTMKMVAINYSFDLLGCKMRMGKWVGRCHLQNNFAVNILISSDQKGQFFRNDQKGVT